MKQIGLKLLFAGVLLSTLIFFQDIISLVNIDGFEGRFINSQPVNFPVTDTQNNRKWLSDFKGEYLVLFFGFVQCSTVCPRVMGVLHSFAEIARKESVSQRILFVSIDPDRDSPSTIHDYINSFDSGIQGVKIASRNIVSQVISQFKGFVNNSNPVEHSGFVYIIDPDGRLMTIYTDENLNAEVMMKDLKKLKKLYKEKNNG